MSTVQIQQYTKDKTKKILRNQTMKPYTATVKETLNDDIDRSQSTFWKNMNRAIVESGTDKEIEYIMNEAMKHGKPFDDIDSALLSPRTKQVKS